MIFNGKGIICIFKHIFQNIRPNVRIIKDYFCSQRQKLLHVCLIDIRLIFTAVYVLSFISLCNCLCVFFPGLFPAVLNLASMADITANATCGLSGPEMYCKLVEHVPGQPVRNPQCRICNQRTTKPFGRKIHTQTHTHKTYRHGDHNN